MILRQYLPKFSLFNAKLCFLGQLAKNKDCFLSPIPYIEIHITEGSLRKCKTSLGGKVAILGHIIKLFKNITPCDRSANPVNSTSGFSCSQIFENGWTVQNKSKMCYPDFLIIIYSKEMNKNIGMAL